MPDAKSGRVHILHQLAVPGGLAAEDAGNHFLLRLTRRSQRCRSGSEISKAGFYQRQGARGRCGSVEGGWLLNGLIFSNRGQTRSFLMFRFAIKKIKETFPLSPSSPSFKFAEMQLHRSGDGSPLTVELIMPLQIWRWLARGESVALAVWAYTHFLAYFLL